MANAGAARAASGNELGRTMERLRRGQPLVVGYFGGSITEGGGASDASKTSWRARTTAWLRETFPKSAVAEVNAAIGGTGSDLGAFRLERDLLKRRPDLVFLEFAVNDHGANHEDRTLRAMEGIVRQIYRANPAAEIVFVYTATKATVAPYEQGSVPNTVAWHQRVAGHYGLASINVGKTLWQAIRDNKGTWETLTTDTVHPNDAGYAVYAEDVRQFLLRHRDDRPRPAARMPAPLVKNPLENGRLVDAWEARAPGWRKEEQSLAGRFPHRLAGSTPGTELRFRFTGTAIGLYWLIAPDSGDIEWSIDGSAPRRASSWDRYALQFTRANYLLLRDDLAHGEHELRLRILPDKQPESKGTWVRIGAFLVN